LLDRQERLGGWGGHVSSPAPSPAGGGARVVGEAAVNGEVDRSRSGTTRAWSRAAPIFRAACSR
jgi:hypothetical protein